MTTVSHVVFSSGSDKRAVLRALRVQDAARRLGAQDPPLARSIDTRVQRLAERIDLDVLAVYAAIPVGGDVGRVADHFLLWLLSVELGAYATSAPVADLYRRRLGGDEPSEKEWAAAVAASEWAIKRMQKKLLQLLRAAPRSRRLHRSPVIVCP